MLELKKIVNEVQLCFSALYVIKLHTLYTLLLVPPPF